jgi:hypothetical protein
VTNVLIRELPDNVHTELVRRATHQGKSLQQYLVSELTRLAATPTLDEVLDRIERRSGRGRVGFQSAVDILDDERSRRDSR